MHSVKYVCVCECEWYWYLLWIEALKGVSVNPGRLEKCFLRLGLITHVVMFEVSLAISAMWQIQEPSGQYMRDSKYKGEQIKTQLIPRTNFVIVELYCVLERYLVKWLFFQMESARKGRYSAIWQHFNLISHTYLPQLVQTCCVFSGCPCFICAQCRYLISLGYQICYRPANRHT